MAAGAPDARADGGAAPGGGGAAAAGAMEPGGHRPKARGEWRGPVPLGGDAGAGWPPRLAGAPADRPAGAPRCRGLGAPGPAVGAGAVAAGFETEQWTLRRIAALVRREFGVDHHPRYLERPLQALGFSVQRPATRARERDERAIAAWPRRDWAAIKKAGPPRGAHHHLPR